MESAETITGMFHATVGADMNPHLSSEHDHQIILDKIEGIENLNHEGYVEDENYYTVDSDY